MGKSLWTSTPKDWEPLVLPEKIVLRPLTVEERRRLDAEMEERTRPYRTVSNPFWPPTRY